MTKSKSRERIEEEVRKTMDTFDQMEEIECSPSFLTRLEGQIRESEKQPKRNFIPIFNPGFIRAALLSVAIFVNLTFSILALRSGKPQLDNREEYISTIASYYDMNSSGLDTLLSSDQR
ncbi:hypothetical protein ACFLT9_07930 [Acidobacteriota bacterium]